MSMTMKQITLLLFLLFPLSVFAQKYPTGKGTFRTGSGATYSQTREDDFTDYKFTITPKLGYFVSDELLAGFTMNYTMDLDTDFTSAIKFTPELKYYYKLSDACFVLANMNCTLDRSTEFSDPKKINDHSNVAVGPGFAYYFTRRIGFEIDVLYLQYLNPDATHISKVTGDGGMVFNVLSKDQLQRQKRKHDYQLHSTDDD